MTFLRPTAFQTWRRATACRKIALDLRRTAVDLKGRWKLIVSTGELMRCAGAQCLTISAERSERLEMDVWGIIGITIVASQGATIVGGALLGCCATGFMMKSVCGETNSDHGVPPPAVRRVRQVQSPATASRLLPRVRNDAPIDESHRAGTSLAARTVSRNGPPSAGSGTPSAPPQDHVLASPRVVSTTPPCTPPPPYPLPPLRRLESPPPYALFAPGVQPPSNSVGSEGVEAPITTQPTATAPS